MNELTRVALTRLRAQAVEDEAEPWKPGKQPSDAIVLRDYIEKIETELSLTKDELFLLNYYRTGNV